MIPTQGTHIQRNSTLDDIVLGFTQFNPLFQDFNRLFKDMACAKGGSVRSIDYASLYVIKSIDPVGKFYLHLKKD